MSDRTQTLSVKAEHVEKLARYQASGTLMQDLCEAARKALSQPEHQGDGPPRCQHGERMSPETAAGEYPGYCGCGVQAQPPAPVLSDGEREKLGQLGEMLEALGCEPDKWPTFLRNLASQEHRGEEEGTQWNARNVIGAIAGELRAHRDVRWDRLIEYGGLIRVYGWLDRADGRADFLLLDFDAATGELREWITSAHPHPASVRDRLQSAASVKCQRVEDHFEIPNAVRLGESQPPAGEVARLRELVCAGLEDMAQSVYPPAAQDAHDLLAVLRDDDPAPSDSHGGQEPCYGVGCGHCRDCDPASTQGENTTTKEEPCPPSGPSSSPTTTSKRSAPEAASPRRPEARPSPSSTTERCEGNCRIPWEPIPGVLTTKDCPGCVDCNPPGRAESFIEIDADEFEEARKDPRVKHLLEQAEAYGRSLGERDHSLPAAVPSEPNETLASEAEKELLAELHAAEDRADKAEAERDRWMARCDEAAADHQAAEKALERAETALEDLAAEFEERAGTRGMHQAAQASYAVAAREAREKAPALKGGEASV